MSPVETPSFVLRQFRRVMFPKRNQIAFGMAVGWGADVQRRLEEENGTLFTKDHLDQLVDKKMLSVGSSWYRRFETAMVGEEWPQTMTAEVKDGQVVVPLDLSKIKGPTTLVFRLLVGLVLAFTLHRVVFSGLMLTRFTEDKRVATERRGQFLVGGDNQRCLAFVDVFHTHDWESMEPFVAGETLEVGVLTYGQCYSSSRLLINGELYAWSNTREPFYQNHEVGYFWDTTNLAPGDYRVTVEVLPYFFSLHQKVVEERTITLE